MSIKCGFLGHSSYFHFLITNLTHTIMSVNPLLPRERNCAPSALLRSPSLSIKGFGESIVEVPGSKLNVYRNECVSNVSTSLCNKLSLRSPAEGAGGIVLPDVVSHVGPSDGGP